MKKNLNILTLAMLLVLFSNSYPQVKHKFVAVDNGNNKLVMIDQINETEWITDIPAGSRDISLPQGGKLLVSHGCISWSDHLV